MQRLVGIGLGLVAIAVGATACISGNDLELEAESEETEQTAVFSFDVDDLCQWFTADEVLAIATDAYEQEQVDLPIPSELVAVPTGIEEGRGCEWTVPGTPAGWGRPDFTVSLYDLSERTLADGTLVIDYAKEEIELGIREPGFPGSAEAAALLAEGLVWAGGWSPGFDIYVETQDSLVNFRHDVAAGVEADENYSVEVRMLNALMAGMGWVDGDEQ